MLKLQSIFLSALIKRYNELEKNFALKSANLLLNRLSLSLDTGNLILLLGSTRI